MSSLFFYNRNVNLSRACPLLVAMLAFTACSQNAVQSKEAVEKGVLEYLQGRSGLDVKAMDVAISNVAFREKEADATVTFRAKGSTDESNAMRMQYVLEQQGGKWVVKGRSGGSGGHGGAMEPAAPSGGALPPGHPPAGGKP